VHCCAGIAIDLLNEVSRDLHFDYDLYMVADGLFGVRRNKSWDGITGDIVNDLAHLSFTAFSTTSSRVQVSALFILCPLSDPETFRFFSSHFWFVPGTLSTCEVLSV